MMPANSSCAASNLCVYAITAPAPEMAGGNRGSTSSDAAESSPRNALVEISSQLLGVPPQFGSLDAIDVPPIAGVVVAEQVERHLGENHRVATVATDHRERAVADSSTRLRLREFDLAAVRAISQPHRARAFVAFGRRRAGIDHESTVARNRRIGPGLRLHRDRWRLCQTGRQTTLRGSLVRPSAATTALAVAVNSQRPITRLAHHRYLYNSRRRKPSVDASSAQRNTCSG